MKKTISLTEHEAQFFLDALQKEGATLLALAAKCEKKHQSEAASGIKKTVLNIQGTMKLLSETFEISAQNAK